MVMAMTMLMIMMMVMSMAVPAGAAIPTAGTRGSLARQLCWDWLSGDGIAQASNTLFYLLGRRACLIKRCRECLRHRRNPNVGDTRELAHSGFDFCGTAGAIHAANCPAIGLGYPGRRRALLADDCVPQSADTLFDLVRRRKRFIKTRRQGLRHG